MPRITKLETLRAAKTQALEELNRAREAQRVAIINLPETDALSTAQQNYGRASVAHLQEHERCAKRSERRATTQFRYRYLATVRDIYGDCKDDDTFPTKSEAMDWAKRNLKTIAPDCSVTVERYAVATMTYSTVWTAGNAQSIARWNGDEDIEDPCDAAHRAFVNANDLTD
jgi:inorganic triphosphatase YgiF